MTHHTQISASKSYWLTTRFVVSRSIITFCRHNRISRRILNPNASCGLQNNFYFQKFQLFQYVSFAFSPKIYHYYYVHKHRFTITNQLELDWLHNNGEAADWTIQTISPCLCYLLESACTSILTKCEVHAHRRPSTPHDIFYKNYSCNIHNTTNLVKIFIVNVEFPIH